MSETKFTLPESLEFDIDNHGSTRMGFGLLANGRNAGIHIVGCEDDAIALSQEVVRRWNAHYDLVAALEALYNAMPDCGPGPLGEAAVLARRAMKKALGEQ